MESAAELVIVDVPEAVGVRGHSFRFCCWFLSASGFHLGRRVGWARLVGQGDGRKMCSWSFFIAQR